MSRPEDVLYRPPAVLRKFFSRELGFIRNQVSGQRIIADASAILATDRWNSFDRFHQTTQTLLGRYGEAGATTSFNHRRARTYNPATTPTTNGAVAEELWRRPEAVRSLHATHAVAAIGPKAREWCRDHDRTGAWSDESPMGRLIHAGGYVLSLGASRWRTVYHVAEVSVSCGCVDSFGAESRILMPDGRVRAARGLVYRETECPVDREPLNEALQRKWRRARVGKADAILVKAFDLWHRRREQLKDKCPSCHVKPLYAEVERS